MDKLSGLVNYSSSEEEDETDRMQKTWLENEAKTLSKIDEKGSSITENIVANFPTTDRSRNPIKKCQDINAPLLGPHLEPNTIAGPISFESDPNLIQLSPYSKGRAILRNLTMPTSPNYEIPSSPTTPPNQEINLKFNRLLELKARGIHFNEKLESSTALKNPTCMQNLMDLANMDETDQYLTTLPKSYWNPKAFPDHAYVDNLENSRRKISKELDKGRSQRESVDFVPAGIESVAS
ncbi:hypothetical protein BGT96224_3785 [Blumeria graminis f. sp. tritici 96224]|uniref:Uncharacterized protein n=3 Tax=Blumeria graminis f. sp. tritici TaxID=62690 RepID=A0A656KL06_BLUGR|nr:hypothetical protein BGT96224_3785 [Blumeria graminis f. sp. tritici 96224]